MSSLGKNWHRFCLKCERCHSILSPGGHAEHNGRPYCHKPCYGALFGPRGVNIGGVGCYLYNPPPPPPASSVSLSPSSFSPPRPRTGLPWAKKRPPYLKTFTGETSLCPGCGDPVYFDGDVFGQKLAPTLPEVPTLQKDPDCWESRGGGMMACLTAISPAMDTYLAPKVGVNIGDVGCYIYDPVDIRSK
ncbi:Cysteine-rich protein 3 [Apodemus speciosus]|uniref:Cysteine-rich protein 3 n=1 Tax=Apodemus speciosus TaxID=105296 RepID=A0ABQ0FPI1_APOSI